MARLFLMKSRTTFIIVSMVVLVYLLCGTSRGDNWVKYDDPYFGFSIEHPPGWTAKMDSNNHIIITSPYGDSTVVIYPFISKANMNASDYVNMYPSASGYVNTYFSDINLNSDYEGIAPGVVRQLNSNTPGLDQAVGSINYTRASDGTLLKEVVLVSIYQQSGMFYSIRAPEDNFEAMKGTLTQILQTLYFTEPSYVQWLEPKENAFTMEVPEGWNVIGGIERYPTGNIGLSEGSRGAIEATSTDGITITWGDVYLPYFFQTPSQLSQQLGFIEGDLMSNRVMLLRKMSGAEFSRWYVENYLAQAYGYTNIVITQNQDLPEKSQAFNDFYIKSGFPMNQNVGEVYFTCSKNGETLNGYYLASINSVNSGMGYETWDVQGIYGYVAPASKDNVASLVLAHMVSSSKPNISWFNNEMNNAMRNAEIFMSTNNEISNIIMERYQTTSQTQDEIFRHFDNFILGQTDVINENGETFKVEAGHNYYWRRGDVVVETETYDRPDTDFEPLMEF
ncbi:hypothetical protein [Methanosarcina sp. 1.H.A.2.2]|uniref:hypothetical protein n=1 Tax=Methanosarcina sp. 1.H.A.2.2 TaxID=1483601 RepID=UPI00062118AA|nr:hypothetical protein [Methanosarcina sp. 1.H.A.2.2]KKH50587.1 hypothetical protein EO93_07965 [Methanosarcina sp. 1.H.A.2.2]